MLLSVAVAAGDVLEPLLVAVSFAHAAKSAATPRARPAPVVFCMVSWRLARDRATGKHIATAEARLPGLSAERGQGELRREPGCARRARGAVQLALRALAADSLQEIELAGLVDAHGGQR